MSKVEIGTRYTKTDSRPYQLDDGARGVHTMTTLNEVTAVNDNGFAYRVVEIVAEQDRPPFAGTPNRGSVAWFGWEAALARGDVEVVD